LDVADVLLASTLIVSPQLLGGATLWSVALIALLSVLTLAVTVWAQGNDVPPSPWQDLAFLGIGVGLLWTAVQAVPLPAELTGWVHPEARGVSGRVSAALGREAPRFVPISRDPGATLAAVVQGIGLLAVFEAARWRSAGGGGVRVLAAVGASAVAMAGVSVVHELAGAGELFGVYDPIFARPIILAPMLNSNHLAGFCGFGVPILWGFALQTPSMAARIALWGSGFLCLSVAFATLSRGGIASSLAGVACFAGLLLLRRRSSRGPNSARAALAVALAAGVSVAAVVWALAKPLSAELDRTPEDKVELLRKGVEFATDAPWVGVGRGGFSASFVERYGSLQRFEHAENLLIHWTSEWGMPVSAVVLVLLLLAYRRSVKYACASNAAAVGAAAALAGIVLHDMVDFALELPATATVAGGSFGALSGLSSASSACQSASSGTRTRFAVAGGSGVALVVVLLLAPGLPATDVRRIEDRLAALAARGAYAKFDDALAKGLSLHPSEPSLALLAGRKARLAQSAGAGRWLNLAMDLAPGWASPHLEAALLLFETGRPEQARIELRSAASLDPKGAVSALCPRLKARDDPDELERVAPREGAQREQFLVAASRCVALHSHVGERADALLLADQEHLPGPQARVALRLASQGKSDDAIRLLNRTVRRTPGSLEVWLALAKVQFDAGDATAAIRSCERGANRVDDAWELIVVRAKAHAALQDDESMRAAIVDLDRLAGDSIPRRAEAAKLLGMLEEKRGHLARAIRAYGRAYRYGSDPRVLEDVARAAERLGDMGRAFAAWAELCSLRPDDTAACEARRRLLPRD
jgi:tetratricopeptide (TPR) repeat protein